MSLNKDIALLNSRIPFTKILDYFDVPYDITDDRFRITCPFHDDERPSLIVYTDNEDNRGDTFWCPPCAQAGDVFLFIRLMIKKKRGLDLNDKADFAESIQILKELGGFEVRIKNLKETILEKLNNEEEPKRARNTEKKFFYMCGVIVRDAVEQGKFNEKEAERIFRLIDERLEKNQLDKAEEMYKKVRTLVQKRGASNANLQM